jgi:hypothetical protein
MYCACSPSTVSDWLRECTQPTGEQVLAILAFLSNKRSRTLRDLDASALRLGEIDLIVLDPLHVNAELRTAIFARIPREQLEKDAATIATLIREDNDNYYEHLSNHCGQVRRFLPRLLKEILRETAWANLFWRRWSL